VRTLAVLDGHAAYAAPGQLSGRWATWVTCPDNVCRVRRESLTTGAIDGPPDPDYVGRPQLGPAVDRHGVVYYERLRSGCRDGELRRWDGRSDRRLLRLPQGYAFQYAYLDGRELYFDLAGCGRGARSDVYRTTVPG
jgi:hypothetical protein